MCAGNANAGGSSIGGGRLFKYSENPWWLENTAEVRYCVEVDEAAFGVSRSDLVQHINAAIATWKDAFAYAQDEGDLVEPYGHLRVATQRFVREECSNSTPLRFQFGVLHREQRAFFDDPRNFVGAAIRTEYDLESLESRGFIYVAPVRGALKPDLDTMHTEAWSAGGASALDIVLRHELGHVFGMPHQSSVLSDEIVGGFRMDLMDEHLAETIVTRAMVVQLATDSRVRSDLERRLRPINLFRARIERTIEGCRGNRPVTEYDGLGLPNDAECSRVVVTDNGVDVYAARREGDDYVLFGRLKGWGSGGGALDWAITVNLPKEQRVFTNNLPRTIHGEFREVDVYRSGDYRTLDGKIAFPTIGHMRLLHAPLFIGIREGRVFEFNFGIGF